MFLFLIINHHLIIYPLTYSRIGFISVHLSCSDSVNKASQLFFLNIVDEKRRREVQVGLLAGLRPPPPLEITLGDKK